MKECSAYSLRSDRSGIHDKMTISAFIGSFPLIQDAYYSPFFWIYFGAFDCITVDAKFETKHADQQTYEKYERKKGQWWPGPWRTIKLKFEVSPAVLFGNAEHCESF